MDSGFMIHGFYSFHDVKLMMLSTSVGQLSMSFCRDVFMTCIALLELNKLRLWNDCLQGRELERKLWLLQVLLTEISIHLFGHRSPPPFSINFVCF